MSALPLVSIAVINYNNAKYVIDTLNSVRNQTYPNIELIITDDCSTDNSASLIKNWLKNYKGSYKFVRHRKNMGVCVTCNSCLKNATGEYFSLIASDDIMLPEKTARQVSFLRDTNDDTAAVYSDAYLMNEAGKPMNGCFIEKHRKFESAPSGNIYLSLLKGNFIPAMSLLIKTKVFEDVGLYDEDLVYEDYDMWLRIAAKYNIVFSDYVSARYRVRRNSLTFTIKNWEYSNAKIFSKHVEAPLPTRWLHDIAWKAYLNEDEGAMVFIRKIAIATSDRILITTYLLWKFNITVDNGELSITEIHNHIARGMSPYIVNSDDSDINIFLSEVIHSLSYELLQKIICDGYEHDNESVRELLDELAIKTQAPYFIAARMLWKMGIPFKIGEPLLKELSEKIGVKIKAQETNSSPQELKDKADDIFGIGSDIFIKEIIPHLTEDLLQDFAYNAYINDNKKAINLVQDVVNKNNDRIILTAILLWRMNIPSSFGKYMMKAVKNALANGLSPVIVTRYSTDFQMFTREVLPYLPREDYERIAAEAYYTNTVVLKPIVRQMLKLTHSRFFKSVLQLWRYKINAYTGKIILNRIDGYCKKGLSNFYIDLCIYKDVVGAIKTKNSDLFR